jgi:hypothetical protein
VNTAAAATTTYMKPYHKHIIYIYMYATSMRLTLVISVDVLLDPEVYSA